MATVKAMTITIDSLLPRLKLDCNVGYNAAVKGASVVVMVRSLSLDLPKGITVITCWGLYK